MDVETAVSMAKMQWELDLLRKEAAAAEVPDDDDGDDDQDEKSGIPSTLFGMTGEQTFQLLNGLKEMLPTLVGGKAAAPRTLGATPAAPAPAAGSAITAEDAALLEAIRNYKAAMPDTATAHIDALLTNFGPGAAAQPETPGQ
jgi:hypothetical protein